MLCRVLDARQKGNDIVCNSSRASSSHPPHFGIAFSNERCFINTIFYYYVPLSNPEMELFVDGSASRSPDTGSGQVGFAICTENDILFSGKLPSYLSAQAAELIALTEACKLAEGKSVNIYTDSRYAFGVVHDFGTLWKQKFPDIIW